MLDAIDPKQLTYLFTFPSYVVEGGGGRLKD